MQFARLATLALFLAPAAAAGAGGPEIDAEAIIDRCWAASREELNSDIPLRIGQGVSAVVACLEYEIVRMVEASQECAAYCGTAANNVGGFYLAERLEGILRELAAERDERVADDAQEFIAEMRARANEQTTVFVHLNDAPPRTVESMVESVIGALVMPCNPMWADGCEIPMGPLVRLLRRAGAPLPAGAITCDRATVHTLETCLPGFEVLPSPSGEQLYLTSRRT